MTAIAGLLSFGEPFGSVESIRTMLNAMRLRGTEHTIMPIQSGAWGSSCVKSRKAPTPLRGTRCVGLLDGVVHAGLGEAQTSASLIAEFESTGPSVFKRIEGEYAIAIWDPQLQQLTLARDPFGHRPLYYYSNQNKFAFASEIKALLASGLVSAELNLPRVADFVLPTLEGINRSSTFYKNLHRVPAGSALVFSRERLEINSFWEPQRSKVRSDSTENFADGFQQLFTEAIRCRTQKLDKTVILLSGGLDSCAIAATTTTLTRDPIRTVSLIAPEDIDDCEETRSIQSAQRFLRLESQNFTPSDALAGLPDIATLMAQLDNPFAANLLGGPIPLYHQAQNAGMKTAVDGLDGDVVTSMSSNFPWFVANEFGFRDGIQAMADDYRHFGNNKELPRALLSFTIRRLLHRLIPRNNPIREGFRRRQSHALWKRMISESPLKPSFADKAHVMDRLQEQAKNDHPFYPETVGDIVAQTIGSPHLPTAIERYEEAASLFGLVATHPFMDLRLIDFCLKLPWDQRIHNGIPKWILREAMRDKLPQPIVDQFKIENIGGWFVNECFKPYRQQHPTPPKWLVDYVEPFIEIESLRRAWQAWVADPSEGISDEVEVAILLGEWLRFHF